MDPKLMSIGLLQDPDPIPRLRFTIIVNIALSEGIVLDTRRENA
jgi:hypothetical protein